MELLSSNCLFCRLYLKMFPFRIWKFIYLTIHKKVKLVCKYKLVDCATFVSFIYFNLIWKVFIFFNCLLILYEKWYVCVRCGFGILFNIIALVLDQVLTGQITGTWSIICTCHTGSPRLKMLSTIFFTWFSERRSKFVVGSYTLSVCLRPQHSLTLWIVLCYLSSGIMQDTAGEVS